MKKMRDALKSLAIIFLAGVLVAGCAKPKNFDYLGFENVRVLKVGLIESTIGMNVKFYNPNSRLQLKRAEVDVHINNSYLGRTVIDTLLDVPRKDTFLVPVTMTIPTISAVSKVLQTLSDTSTLVKLQGKATVGKGGVFFNYPIEYEGKQKIVF